MEDTTSTWDVIFEHKWLDYKLHHIEQENIVDDECTEDVCTFLTEYSPSTLDKSFSGVSKTH